MSQVIDVLLLNALPASGKSELRKYLEHLDANVVTHDFHMGPTVQLDDYPYVHLMRRISQELANLGEKPIFFPSNDQPFSEPLDWGTLIELLNEDYRDLRLKPRIATDSAADWLFDRLDAARRRCGAAAELSGLAPRIRAAVARGLETEARNVLEAKTAAFPPTLDGRTVVIEFARGGPQGASMPLAAPFGYAYSLARLADEILARACVLYIWVTPEESRRKNDERAKPGREGDASILHHGVPIAVMLGDYGTDDMAHLIAASQRPDTVRLDVRGRTVHLPVARFDNRRDLTTFVRDDPSNWRPGDVAPLHAELKRAMGALHDAQQRRSP